jgi:hypothetical protein
MNWYKKKKNMKKLLFLLIIFNCQFSIINSISAEPKITFDKTTHNYGTFSEKAPIQKCVFTFTNTGDQPLVINSAVASCGCTVPKYTKSPIKPGETGTINVTYNGKGKFPGHFKKTITVRSNGTPEMVRLYIEGDMTEEK